jgi:hypothetical protein
MLVACSTKVEEENTVTTAAVKNVIVATDNTDTYENVMGPQLISAVDSTFAMRFIGQPLAKAETKVVPAACKVIHRALTAAGNIAVRLGVACLAAGKRAHDSKLARNGLESVKERLEGSINASQR